MPQILNVAPVLYNGANISIEKFTYSEELFSEFQDKCRRTHLVKRSGNDIMLVPLTPDAPRQGGENATIDLRQDLSLVRSLATNSLFRTLLAENYWIYRVKPVSWLWLKGNLLDESLPQGVKSVKGLGVYVKWEVDFRVVDPLGNGSFVSMNINISTAPRVAMSCQSLINSGFPLHGYYVGVPNSSKNPDLKPRFQTMGRVTAILDSGLIRLDDVKEGQPAEVDPIDVFLEPREDILEACVRYFYKEHASEVLANLQKKSAEYHIGDKKLTKLKTGLKDLQKLPLELLSGVPFQIGEFLTDKTATPPAPCIEVQTAEKPRFIYTYGGSKFDEHNDRGLKNYGPYSKEYFTPVKPRICVICQAKKKGQVELIVHKFLNGIPPVNWGKEGRTFEYTGLKTKFYLQESTPEFFTAADDSADAYYKAITNALQAANDSSQPWNLAIVQVDAAFRDRPADKNPYLLAKARFISQGVAVQEFALEVLNGPDERVMWSLNNMALATYAKMGGEPWLLTAERPIAHEVVFGIGSAMVHNSRMSRKERMVGITTVFTGDGSYFLNNISAAVSAEDYFETLLHNLRNTMERVKTSYNWQPRDSVWLIFHAFKTFKDKEAEAVKAVMKELGDYQVEFAFVHVAATHPYLLFDTNQPGVGYYKKGIFAPSRMKYFRLSDHVSIVCLTGAQELKQASDGMPQPVQLILHKDSTFKDMTYLARQVVKFGAHSWRSFSPAPMPVTVYYSQLVAQMLSQLTGVNSWNPDSLYNKIGSTRWFL